jgi:hypothetical protein
MSKYLRKDASIHSKLKVFAVYYKTKDLFSIFREAKPLVAFDTEKAAESYCYRMQSMCSWKIIYFYDILDMEQ